MTIKLVTDVDGAIATVRLASPERGNAFGPDDHFALCEALATAAGREGVRCIVLTGTGPIFSAGADASALGSIEPEQLEAAMLKSLAVVEATVDGCALPIIGAINGPCFGGAVGLALKCDVLIAAESARFGFPFAKLGLIPDSGLTYLLPRLIGEQRARALFMTGGEICARDALAFGLVHAVCPDDALPDQTRTLAERCAAMPTGSARAIRRALIRSRGATLSEQMAFEAAEQRKAVAADGFKERVAAALRPRKS